jgi:hypothetical protein
MATDNLGDRLLQEADCVIVADASLLEEGGDATDDPCVAGPAG